MPDRQIFIASATESRRTAEAIAKMLEAGANYRVRRWWQEVKPGQFTIDSLTSAARDCDGAVFLLDGIDRLVVRKKQTKAARDNVILEYGLFVSQVGRERCLLLHGPGTRLPSDITGIACDHLDKPQLAQRVVDHFERCFTVSAIDPIRGFRIIADPHLVNIDLDVQHRPIGWRQRDLYFGEAGGKNWLKLVADPKYQELAYPESLRNALLRCISDRSVKPRSLVSFGPGDAKLDVNLATMLRARDPDLCYLPIDISTVLLHTALRELSEHVDAVAGLLTDFEDRFPFIQYHLNRYVRRPILISILGNTIANLDHLSEEAFLTNVYGLMQPGDSFLFDATVRKKGWSQRKDARTSHGNYGDAYRTFLCHGISVRTGEPIHEVRKDFDKRIRFVHAAEPYGETIKTIDQSTNNTLFRHRRYDWVRMLARMKKIGFKLKAQTIVDSSGTSSVADGVALFVK